MKSSSSNSNNSINDDFISSLIKKIKSSKILILIFTSLFAFLAVIYSNNQKPSYITNALVEIGSYGLIENRQYTTVLIRKRSSLIEDLEIKFNLQNNNQFPIIITPQLSNLIHLNVKSYNTKDGLVLVKKVLAHLIDSNQEAEFAEKQALLDEIQALNFKIAKTDRQLDFIRSQQNSINEVKKNKIKNEIATLKERIVFNSNTRKKNIETNLMQLNLSLLSLDSKIQELKQIILEDTENLILLGSSPDIMIEMASRVPTLNSVIYGYKIQLIEYQADKTAVSDMISNLTASLENWEGEDQSSIDSFNIIKQISSLREELKLINNTVVNNANSSSDYFFGEESYTYELVEERKELIQEKLLLEIEIEKDIEEDFNRSQFKFVNPINTAVVTKNSQLFGTLGLIFGFLFSILFVFAIDLLKTYRRN